MVSLKYINSLVLTIMLLMPFHQYCFDTNKITQCKNISVSLKHEIEDSSKNRKRVKLRPEKEVNNIININNINDL